MSFPTPKFNIGDKAFHASASYMAVKKTCPDCLGTRYWAVTTPAGEQFDIECGTCQYGYEVRGYVEQYQDVAISKHVTIGSIQIDTNDGCPVRYMCIETGVGTGSVYREWDLFDNEESAFQQAKLLAAKMTEERQAQHDRNQQGEKKKRLRPKPSWQDRRIRELEKQLETVEKGCEI